MVYNFNSGFKKGRTPWNKGKHWSDEVKKNISEGIKKVYVKEKHPLYGKKHSPEAIEKMRQIKLGKKMSDDTKLKMSISSHKSFNSGRLNSERTSGKRNWNYKDGKCKERDKERKSKEALKVYFEKTGIYRIPEGCVIHHIDQNPLNNSPENLQMMDRSFHVQLHTEFHRLNKELVAV